MKKISIIVATFNASTTLHKCIDSIVAQKTNKCELIIIDGASSDTTIDIVQSYGKQIDEFVSEPDEGVYDAWNKGILRSSGDWVMFIGADDQLLPNALSSYLDLLSNCLPNNKIDYICSKNQLLDVNGKTLKIFGEAPHWSRMKKNMVAAHVGSLHSRNYLFNEIGLYNTKFKICADYELLLRKGKNLNFYFHPVQIAKMSVGGMSFSFKAIYETYVIRKRIRSLSPTLNFLMFGINFILFYFFLIRKRIMGFKV